MLNTHVLLVYLKSAKLELLILYLMCFNCALSSAKVQIKIHYIFDCAKEEILQIYLPLCND